MFLCTVELVVMKLKPPCGLHDAAGAEQVAPKLAKFVAVYFTVV